MAGVTNPFFQPLFPVQENIIPWNYQITPDEWIYGLNATENNPFFRAQWVQCSYQISSIYGPMPRYLFYILFLVSVAGRKLSWIVPAALTSVMIYSSTAAIHAFVLAIIRKVMVPQYMTDNHEVVLVLGASETGLSESPRLNGPVWLPLLPMAWDDDGDPINAIVACAFLLFLPMQIWCKEVRKAKPSQKIIVFPWALLLFVGIISAFVYEFYIDVWSFPQLRFCPIDQEDTLPILNSGFDSVAGPWNGRDRYHWNRTIQDYFIHKNLTVRPPNICLYPCFDSQWPLRDPADILVVNGSYGDTFDTNTSFTLLFVGVVLVICSGCSSLTVLTLRFLLNRPTFAGWQDLELRAIFKKTIQAGKNLSRNPTSFSTYWTLFWRVWILVSICYALILSPIAITIIIVYSEWEIWVSDPGGETPIHIGQWAALVAAVVVFLAALVPKLLSKLESVLSFAVKKRFWGSNWIATLWLHLYFRASTSNDDIQIEGFHNRGTQNSPIILTVRKHPTYWY